MDNKEKFGVELDLETSSFKKKLKEIADKMKETATLFKQGYSINTAKLENSLARTSKRIEDTGNRLRELDKEVIAPKIDIEEATQRISELDKKLEELKFQKNMEVVPNQDGGEMKIHYQNDSFYVNEEVAKQITLLEQERAKIEEQIALTEKLQTQLYLNGKEYEKNDSILYMAQEHAKELEEKLAQVNTTAGKIGNTLSNSFNGAIPKMIRKVGELREKLQQATNKIGEFFSRPADGKYTFTDFIANGLVKGTSLVKNFASNIKTTLGGAFDKVGNKSGGLFGGLAKTFGGIKSHASGLGSSINGAFSNGIGSVKRFALALLGVRAIWTMISQQARNYISQNEQIQAQTQVLAAGFQQLLAPAINFIVNLLSTAMSYLSAFIKLLTGVDIIKKGMASVAKSAKGTAGSVSKAAKDTKGALAGFDEINNIAQDDNSGGSGGGGGGGGASLPTPSFKEVTLPDLDKIGETIAKKLNEAMSKINWSKIQNGARTIAKGIADNINGFCLTLDWSLLGKTIGEGVNTAVYFAQTFVKTIKWEEIGGEMVKGLNSYYKTVDWSAVGDTISTGFSGVLDFGSAFIEGFDAEAFIQAICDYFAGINWGELVESIVRFLTNALIILPLKLAIAIGNKIGEGVDAAKQYFKDKIEESGGNVVAGILKGIGDALKNIWNWIKEHVFQPIIDAFKNAFGINSPSIVMEEQGNFIVDGLLNAIKKAPEKIKQIWEDLKTKTKEKMAQIRSSIEEKFHNIGDWFKTKFNDAWQKIKSVFSVSTISTFFGNIWNTIKSKFTNIGQNIGNAVGGAFRGAVNAVLRTLERVLNVPINAINGMIGIINKLPGVSIGKLSTFSLPRLATGTNYVPADTIAMIHKGEAVVPKKFNEDEYFGRGSEETNTLIRELIEIVSDLDFNTYLDGKKISQNTIDYINNQNRVMGRSVI